ncbi:MAG: hypothetical protein R3D25_04875 [Geminicoccaceae bacterium]
MAALVQRQRAAAGGDLSEECSGRRGRRGEPQLDRKARAGSTGRQQGWRAARGRARSVAGLVGTGALAPVGVWCPAVGRPTPPAPVPAAGSTGGLAAGLTVLTELERSARR